jgi:predicted dehydrogenase
VDQQPVRIGVVGGGLMGRELAGLVGRWPSLVDHPCRPEIVAVADPNPTARDWFATVPSVRTLTDDWRHLLDDDGIDVLYLAVPHQLHEELYLAVAAAGRDFLGEKPFGIDLSASRRIVAAVETSSAFVRVSSEMPFFPGAQRAVAYAASGALGEVVEVRSGFAHSSDVDRSKPSNWKRRAETCGEIGVMGDLGMHVAHVPVRLGWLPASVYAVLDDIVRTRPDPSGGAGATVPCDTWDNAMLACRVAAEPPTAQDGRRFPMVWETRRIAPGQMNTWWFEALGMDGGVRFSTRTPTVLERFARRDGEQIWEQVQPGNVSVWPTHAGAIFEFGFADALLQMWAAYLAERAGALGDRFGCATPQEALASHEVFDAALRSHDSGAAEPLGPAHERAAGS